MTYNSDSILNTLSTIAGDSSIIQDECRRQISVLDTAKGPYLSAAQNLDRACHNLITPVNDTLYATRDAYDQRIDVQGCRTDLFWRLTGITSSTQTTGGGAGGRGPDVYTFVCTKLGTTYTKTDTSGITSTTIGMASSVGLSTNSVTYFNGTTFTSVPMEEEGDLLKGTGTFFDTYYQPDNLHGYKLYDEPYADTELDTFRGVGVGTISIGGNSGVSVYTQIGLESYVSTHNAPILFTQALDDPVGGGNQSSWLQSYYNEVDANPANATATLTTIPTGGHAAFVNDSYLQGEIRTFLGSNAGSGAIANTQLTIVPTDGETHSIGSTSYPVMGKLYVPTGLVASSIDVVVVFHGTVDNDSGDTIQDASNTALTQFLNQSGLNVRDKIIFSAAYPQDHITNVKQYNLAGVGTETSTFLMGDNLPYTRAAVGWVKNSLNAYISAQGGSKTIGDVYLFGHSQGGKLVSKMNTLETGITGVIANAPGPIQFDQTCTADATNTSCSKVAAIYGITGFVGVTANSNFMTILNPDLIGTIEVGQLVTPSVPGYFASGSVTVTGIGTTNADLSSYSFTGIATTKPQAVPYITVSESPVQSITAPLSDGTFVDMLFSQDPDTISDSIAVSMDDNPYVDQTIEIMSYNRAGAGVSIFYTNTGIASGTRAWNKFLDGFPDPNTEDPEDMDTKISEPPIGADKIFYRVGFTEKPVNPVGGADASEGTVISISDQQLFPSMLSTFYQSLPTCDDAALNAAISARDTAESNLASNPARDGMADVSNAVKKKLNDEFNLRIWGYRMQMGENDSRKSDYDSFAEIMNTSEFRDIINDGSTDD